MSFLSSRAGPLLTALTGAAAVHVSYGCSTPIATDFGGGAGGFSEDASSSTHSGSQAPGPSSGSWNAASWLGAPCEVDADCSSPALFCVRATDDDPIFGGGAAGGYCTAPCEKSSDCFGELSVCAFDGTEGRCLQGCERGDHPAKSLEAPVAPEKCLGRSDLRCVAVQGVDVCVPSCATDAECGERACDPRSAVCVDTPHRGAPMGTTCDPMETASVCEGVCVPFVQGEAACSRPCSYAGEPLTSTTDCGGLEHGLCAFAYEGAAAGDGAYCTASCTSHAACLQPDVLFCFDFFGFLGEEGVGKGYCFAGTDCTTEGAPCDGDSDFPPNGVCTKTPGGKLKCVDPTYPAEPQGGAEAPGPGPEGR